MWRLTVADWSKVADRVDVTVFNQPFATAGSRRQRAEGFRDHLRDARTHAVSAHACLQALPNLKLLITSGMRNAAIDMEAAKDHKVVLCGTQWGRDPTAPLTMGLILELTRNIGRENARMHAGEPLQKFVGMEIEGRTLGVIGLGKLGTKVSKLAQAFGMNVIAWSPNLTPEKCKEAGVTYATKEELFATADIVTIHVVLSQRSRGLVGARRARADEADRLPRQHRARADRRRRRAAGSADAEEDRGRRHRRVLGRAAAGRPSVPQARQHRADAASRLRHRGQLSQPLPADGRGHRRLVQGRSRSSGCA